MPKITYTQHDIAAGEWTSNGLMLRNPRGRSVLHQATNIAATFGTYKAARYMRTRGWSLEAALWHLARAT